jgi:hypothetical protein
MSTTIIPYVRIYSHFPRLVETGKLNVIEKRKIGSEYQFSNLNLFLRVKRRVRTEEEEEESKKEEATNNYRRRVDSSYLCGQLSSKECSQHGCIVKIPKDSGENGVEPGCGNWRMSSYRVLRSRKTRSSRNG